MALTLLITLAAAQTINAWAQTGLPQRNLLVEWRMSSTSQQQGDMAGVRQGEVVVDSRRGMMGRATVTVSSSTRSRSESSHQQIQVLNGGQARLYVGTSTPVALWQFSTGVPPGGFGSGGPASWQAWSTTTLVDTGRGLSVRPRWTSGSDQVTVELQARVAQESPNAPPGQTESSEVMTTLQMPLREWTAVAKRGGQTQRRWRGTLSTEDITLDDAEVLELRVSVP
ncbi:MAG: hypothetical protein KGL90_13275 [Burkholderiales bacterium]|nr:hypothetical protein [Burkholderiales bacterium]